MTPILKQISQEQIGENPTEQEIVDFASNIAYCSRMFLMQRTDKINSNHYELYIHLINDCLTESSLESSFKPVLGNDVITFNERSHSDIEQNIKVNIYKFLKNT